MSPKPLKLESSKLVHSFILALPTSTKYNISERRHGLGHVTPRKFGIPSTMSRKPIKLETSKLGHGFDLSLPTMWKYNMSEKGSGLGHVIPRKFGLSSIICPILG